MEEEDNIKAEITKVSFGISSSIEDEFIEFISQYPVSGLIASTGSGKSTRIPKAVAKAGARVFVPQPTVLAAVFAANYVGKDFDPGYVGFAVEGEVRYNDNTQIIYCTSGHLKNKMLSYFQKGEVPSGDISFCDIILLDEAHSGSLDNDIIMQLWVYAYSKNIAVPKLVLMSATLSKETTIFKDLPLFEIETPSKKIIEYYHDKDYREPTDKKLYVDVASVVIQFHINNPVPEDKISKYIVFCAGTSEVKTVMEILDKSELDKTIVIPAYSDLDKESQDRLKEDPPLGHRLIIVSTNIAEASLTIEGLDGVFDTLTEKIAETSKNGGLRLVVKHVSKSSAKQRRGRTGRTNDGFVYRMCTPAFFEKLAPQREPEIFRVPLTGTIMLLLDKGLDPIVLFNGRLRPDRIKKDLDILKMLKMIDKEQTVTDAGKFAAKFPLSVRSSAMIYEWTKLSKKDGSAYPIFPIVVLAAIIDSYGPSYFYTTKKELGQTAKEYGIFKTAYYETYFKKYKASTDLEVLLNFWNDTISQFEVVNPNKGMLGKWCYENSFNGKKVTELFNIVKQCCDRLVSLKYYVEMGNFNPKVVLDVSKPLFKFAYADSIYEQRGSNYYNLKTGEYYKLDRSLIPESKTMPKQVVALSTSEIVGGMTIRTIALSHPI
jgi:HrpA-like RNA helicase